MFSFIFNYYCYVDVWIRLFEYFCETFLDIY